MVDSPDLAAAKRLLHAVKEAGFVFQRIAPGEDAPLLGLRQSSPPQRWVASHGRCKRGRT